MYITSLGLVSMLEYRYIQQAKDCKYKPDPGKPDVINHKCCGHYEYCRYCKHCLSNLANEWVDPEQDDSKDINREINVIRALINGEPRPHECGCREHGDVEEDYLGDCSSCEEIEGC